MKKKTEALAKKIAGEAFLEHFRLVGGTALSVYLKHRLSEDLDFATAEGKLPEEAISEKVAGSGLSMPEKVAGSGLSMPHFNKYKKTRVMWHGKT